MKKLQISGAKFLTRREMRKTRGGKSANFGECVNGLFEANSDFDYLSMRGKACSCMEMLESYSNMNEDGSGKAVLGVMFRHLFFCH